VEYGKPYGMVGFPYTCDSKRAYPYYLLTFNLFLRLMIEINKNDTPLYVELVLCALLLSGYHIYHTLFCRAPPYPKVGTTDLILAVVPCSHYGIEDTK
jgi:hypothetical protein